MELISRAGGLVAKPQWRKEDFYPLTPQHMACLRRDWSKQAAKMQMRDPQRGAILQILRHQLDFYERKKDEDEADEAIANEIMASRQAARASAVEEARLAAREQEKATEEKIRLKKAMREFGEELRSPRSGPVLWSLWE
jgi:hypothetical protein